MISVSHLVKNYGSFPALKDISFHIQKGEVVGLLGANGAGKSTTMNILTGYISYTAGEVLIAGINNLENPKAAKRHIGYLPEKPPVYMDMTVSEYLRFICGLKQTKLSGQAQRSHLDEIASQTGLERVFTRRIGNLSKGYRQRVGFAQALVGKPDILILDEPTVGLDPAQIIEIRELIRTLGQSHCIMLSSHILSEVQSVCNRILILHNGYLAADESTSQLAHADGRDARYQVRLSGQSERLFPILANIPHVLSVTPLPAPGPDACEFALRADEAADILTPLFYAMVAADAPILSLNRTDHTLEDIYIRMIKGETDPAQNGAQATSAAPQQGGEPA